MKKRTTMTHAILAGLLTCGMALSTVASVTSAPPQTVTAATQEAEKISVTLNKLGVKTAMAIDNANPGDLSGIPRLNGAQFQAYDITTLYHQVKTANSDWTDQAVMDYISLNWAGIQANTDYTGSFTKIGVPVTTTGDGDNKGQALFADLPVKTDDVYRIYLFDEVEGIENYLKAVPTIIGLPGVDKSKTNYDLYPKNIGMEKVLLDETHNARPELTESGEKIVYNYEVGKTVSYRSTVTVPANIHARRGENGYEYETLTFKDQMTIGGADFISGTVKITTADGTDVTDIVTAAAAYSDSNGAGTWSGHAGFSYRIDFSTDNPGLAEFISLRGQTLTFTYDMKINDQAVPTQDIGNDFYLVLKTVSETKETVLKDPSAEIETGAHLFTKRDAQSKDGLPDAKFKIQRGDLWAKFYYLNDAGVEVETNPLTTGTYKPIRIRWVSEGEATTLTSGTGGVLTVQGLEDGNYTLVETEAPDGYVMAAKNTAFKITEGAVGTTDLTPKDVYNSPDTGFLPTTGSTGIIAFLIIGASAMGGAAYYKKRKG